MEKTIKLASKEVNLLYFILTKQAEELNKDIEKVRKGSPALHILEKMAEELEEIVYKLEQVK